MYREPNSAAEGCNICGQSYRDHFMEIYFYGSHLAFEYFTHGLTLMYLLKDNIVYLVLPKKKPFLFSVHEYKCDK